MASRRKVSERQQNYEQELRQKRKERFIKQFEKEAQARLNEMEANMNKILESVDRAFEIELMKMPLSLRNTLMKDLINDDGTAMGEVTMALTSASPEIRKPLSRKPSKKGLNATAGQQSSSNQNKTPSVKGPKQKPAKKTLHNSKSTGSLRCASTVRTKSTSGQVLKSGVRGQFRQASRSVGDEMMASVTVVTSQGETLFLSEDNKDDLNVELFDSVTVDQMRKIKDLMDYLCDKVTPR